MVDSCDHVERDPLSILPGADRDSSLGFFFYNSPLLPFHAGLSLTYGTINNQALQ